MIKYNGVQGNELAVELEHINPLLEEGRDDARRADRAKGIESQRQVERILDLLKDHINEFSRTEC